MLSTYYIEQTSHAIIVFHPTNCLREVELHPSHLSKKACLRARREVEVYPLGGRKKN